MTQQAANRVTHTPGPWEAKFTEEGGYDCMTDAWQISSETRAYIATLDMNNYGDGPYRRSTPVDKQIAESDALLIAAAPDLLAMLKDVMAYWQTTGFDTDGADDCQCLTCQVKAAIAKAEGRS